MFIKKGVIIIACIALIFVAGCTWLDTKAFYAEHPTSGEDIRQIWGEPYRIDTLEDGSFKWYHYSNYERYIRVKNYQLYGSAYSVYFIIKNNRVVDSGTIPY
jgi:hypothetical protein